jgi:hypothetical protein
MSSFPLRLRIDNLRHDGAKRFLSSVNSSECLDSCIQRVLKKLYLSPDWPHAHLPPARSVTLFLDDMGGVAYTSGSALDNDHKEIHFSMSYISEIAGDRATHEITGVLTHELVHCFQYNGKGQAPGGLIEGIADWVRLTSGLGPPWWEPDFPDKWDAGYSTTAYFLDYLETRFGHGTVRRINLWLRTRAYTGELWTTLLGRPVSQLWEDYKREKQPQKDKGSKTHNGDASFQEEVKE